MRDGVHTTLVASGEDKQLLNRRDYPNMPENWEAAAHPHGRIHSSKFRQIALGNANVLIDLYQGGGAKL